MKVKGGGKMLPAPYVKIAEVYKLDIKLNIYIVPPSNSTGGAKNVQNKRAGLSGEKGCDKR